MASNVALRKVPCEQRVIEYELTRKRVKNINLRVKADGQIVVSANDMVPVDFIDNFIKEKQIFIIQALEKYEKTRSQIPDEPRRYVSGECFSILGKSVFLKVTQEQRESVETDGAFIYLVVKNEENQKHKEALMNRWLKELQIETFQQICREIHPAFRKYNVEYPLMKIRYMTSRWGSCQPRKGVITLNSRLIEEPRECIEYVVLHEFSHFIHPNHSKRFYDFVTMLMPDWKERKKKLEKRS